MYQEVEEPQAEGAAADAQRKRHAFESFYKGWQDRNEGRPEKPPAGWSEEDKGWYRCGWRSAPFPENSTE